MLPGNEGWIFWGVVETQKLELTSQIRCEGFVVLSSQICMSWYLPFF